MKNYLLLIAITIFLASCSTKRQAASKLGKVDDTYFTVNDVVGTPKKETKKRESLQNNQNTQSNAGNFTNSYSNRLRNFGTNNSFFYTQSPFMPPMISYNPFMGWNGQFGMDPGFMGMYHHNSAFSPFYGCGMPFNNPFLYNGWNQQSMFGYNPYFAHNPFMTWSPFNNFGWNDNNNRGAWGSGNSSRTENRVYTRRTGSSNNVPAQNTYTPAPQNRNSPNNTNTNTNTNSGNSWYSGSTSPSSSGSSSGNNSGSSSGSRNNSSGGSWYGGSTSPNSGGGSSGGSRSSGSSGGSGGSGSGGGSTRRR